MLLDEAHVHTNVTTWPPRPRANRVHCAHFKTHQSAAIGEWFRADGVNAITVS